MSVVHLVIAVLCVQVALIAGAFEGESFVNTLDSSEDFIKYGNSSGELGHIVYGKEGLCLTDLDEFRNCGLISEVKI